MTSDDSNPDFERARGLIRTAQRVMVLTGAGISAESGLPTYQGTGGLWDDVALRDWATPEGYARDPHRAWRWYSDRRVQLGRVAPHGGHTALARLERQVKRRDGHFTLATQNVDNLHQAAGSERVLELHGSMLNIRCPDCRYIAHVGHEPMDEIPACPECGSPLRPAVVWFGEMLPQDVWQEAAEQAVLCDLFMIVGTSAQVYPAAGLRDIAAEAGAHSIEINPNAPPSACWSRSPCTVRPAKSFPRSSTSDKLGFGGHLFRFDHEPQPPPCRRTSDNVPCLRGGKMNTDKAKQLLLRVWNWSRPIILIVIIATALRSSLADWNDVPSGSMNPTIVEGDRIFVNKLAYDLKVPFTKWQLAEWDQPERGDIIVFFSPKNGQRLVKRVVGLPGDVIAMRDNILFVNGVSATYELATPADMKDVGPVQPDQQMLLETIGGRTYPVLWTPRVDARRALNPVRVPEGHYFTLGDNRDSSADSRYFGFVPEENIAGRSSRVIISLDWKHFLMPRFDRFLKSLNE